MAASAAPTLTPYEQPVTNIAFGVRADPKADELVTDAMIPFMGNAAMRGQVDERNVRFMPDTIADQAASTHGGNIAHIYQAQRNGDPGWGQTQAWGLAGYDPSISEYDRNFGTSENDFHSAVKAGFKQLFSRLPLSAPTMTREGRVSANRNSLPAARFFQSYTGAGTGQNWSGATNAQGQRSIRLGWNPNMQGVAEAKPAMTYDPFPSPASLYPKVV